MCIRDRGRREEVSAEELIQKPLILREVGSGTRQLFENAMMLHNLSVKPHWECISTQAIVNAVMMNVGISVLPARQMCIRDSPRTASPSGTGAPNFDR